MSYWSIYERARNIGGKRSPHYVTVWTGRDEGGQRRWLVNSKPDPNSEGGPIHGVQGGPASVGHGAQPTTLREAIAAYCEEEVLTRAD
jgi:hypothetical protein